MKKKKKVAQARFEYITFYCPKLKRNVRVSFHDIDWSGDFDYGSILAVASFKCRCKEQHEVRGPQVGNYDTDDMMAY